MSADEFTVREYTAVMFVMRSATDREELDRLVGGFFPEGGPIEGTDYVLRCTSVTQGDDLSVTAKFAIVPAKPV